MGLRSVTIGYNHPDINVGAKLGMERGNNLTLPSTLEYDAAKLFCKTVGTDMVKFAKNGNDNVIAKYDLGQSAMSLVLQAQSMGLFTHQMGGFDSEKARTLFNLPENYVAVSIIAVGYLGTLDQLGEDLRKLEESPRQRKEQTEFVFTKWGTPFK